ncbi:ester cyclase [Flavivirga amylovorans]|uniref:Ester cyclase n=1 Tax=Flavivirga amylovorans TaxID=870486 RepID=A0ABT8WY87_9FLAO|nr:ester cyclase [Flavivirga amylovorans]MDO5986592.1 ester cyclase [Flavivirga amylovorans]
MKSFKVFTLLTILLLCLNSCSEDDGNDTEQLETQQTRIEELLAEIERLELVIEELNVKVEANENLAIEAARLEANEKLVSDFYQEFFGDKNLESIHKYIGDIYIQHNPSLADGKQALIDWASPWFPTASKETIDVQKLFAADDLVFIHTKTGLEPRPTSVMDVFRVEDNKLVEHWDVIQRVPKVVANDHPMF